VQSELNFLKSQINPHFLFNTLNSLYALTIKKSDKAPDIVIKLSEMMRYMLYECNEKYVPLEKELTYLKNYIELEKLRQPTSIHIDFRVIGNTDNLVVSPLIFISFLENAFKHGISSRIDYGFVKIQFLIQKEILEFTIENSKTEKIQLQMKNFGGIGLVNAKKRLEMIYPDQYSLDIIDLKDVYTVNLNINLNKQS
jgi:LytS/YehU family sensor histidine kinase